MKLLKLFYSQKKQQRDFLWADRLRQLGFPQPLSLKRYKGYYTVNRLDIEVYVPTTKELKKFLSADYIKREKEYAEKGGAREFVNVIDYK